MTIGSRGSGDGPGTGEAGPSSSLEPANDPLLRPASDAGWDDERPASPQPPDSATEPARRAGPSFPAFVPPTSAPTSPDPPQPETVRSDPASALASSTGSLPGTSGASMPRLRTASATLVGTTPAGAAPAIPARIALPIPATYATQVDLPAMADSAAGDEPLLPRTYHENDLRSAVGATPLVEPTLAPAASYRRADTDRGRDNDDDDGPRPRNRKAVMALALSIAGGLAIGALVLLGHLNSGRYLLACEPEIAVPEQGRAFPPWGSHALEGAAWMPLKIAPETRCQPRETDDVLVLERSFLAMLLEQADALLTAREVTRLDDAEALLKQGLLLTRPPEAEPASLAAARSEHRKQIEQLLGDVSYWRASAKLREAAAALAEAAGRFDTAVAQHPRHVADAPAWAGYARKLAQELRAGPGGPTPAAASAAPAPTAERAEDRPSDRPAARVGTALPVEPDKPAADARELTPPPVDAGPLTGGVLL